MIEIIDKTVPTIKVDGVEKKVTIVINNTPHFKDEEGHLYKIPGDIRVFTITVDEFCDNNTNNMRTVLKKTVKGYLDGELAWNDYDGFDKYYSELPYSKGYKYYEEPVDNRTREITAIFQPEGYNFRLVKTITLDIY